MPKVSDDYLAARRAHILAAASRRFAAAGFHRTSMQDVISEAELSPGAVYRYFRSKEEIIQAIASEAMGSIEAIVRRALETHRPLADLVAELPAAFHGLDQADERIRIAVQTWGEALRNPDLAVALRIGLDGVRAALRDRLEQGLGDGELSPGIDVIGTVDVLLAIIQGYLLQRSWNPGLDPARYGRAAAGVVAGGLVMPGSPAPAADRR